MEKFTKEEKHRIYNSPLNSQFVRIGMDTVFPVKRHVLKSEDAEDYAQVLRAALAYSDEAEVQIMPEIHKSELEIRERFKIPSDNKNPDLKVGDYWVDVKCPKSYKKIIPNANDAARQGAIACIMDDFIELSHRMMEEKSKNILASKLYGKEEVHFYFEGVLYKYNSQGLIE